MHAKDWIVQMPVILFLGLNLAYRLDADGFKGSRWNWANVNTLIWRRFYVK